MELSELIKICKERNELDFLFNITKHIAESDSIGEQHGYCNEYTKKMFNNGEMHIQTEEYKLRGGDDFYCEYLEYGSSQIYKLYLQQIGFLEK